MVIGFFQNDVVLLHAIEADLGKQLEEFECKEQDVLSDITRVRSLGIQFGDLSSFTFDYWIFTSMIDWSFCVLV